MRECDVILDIDIELLHGHREPEDPREDGEIANRNRKIAYTHTHAPCKNGMAWRALPR